MAVVSHSLLLSALFVAACAGGNSTEASRAGMVVVEKPTRHFLQPVAVSVRETVTLDSYGNYGYGGAAPTGPVPAGQFPAGQVPAGQFPAGPVPAGQVPVGQFPIGGQGFEQGSGYGNYSHGSVLALLLILLFVGCTCYCVIHACTGLCNECCGPPCCGLCPCMGSYGGYGGYSGESMAMAGMAGMAAGAMMDKEFGGGYGGGYGNPGGYSGQPMY